MVSVPFTITSNLVVSNTSQTTTIAPTFLATGNTTSNSYISTQDLKINGASFVFSVTSRTALKNIDPAYMQQVYLKESLRNGTFVWTTGNFATKVTNDPLEGVYVASNLIATTSGAWVRQVESDYRFEFWGAVGDGTTNDAAAVQAGLDFITNQGLSGGVFRFLPKTYSLGSEISVPQGIELRGSGHNAVTRLTATHSAGAVLKFSGTRAGCYDLEVYASAGRNSGSATNGAAENCGILSTAQFFDAKRVRVFNQPSHGILCSGGTFLSVLDDVSASSNKGHGICVDPGDENGDTPTVPGLMSINRPSLNSNGGHALCLGRPSSSGSGANSLRVEVFMADCNDNGQTPGLLYEDAIFYCRGVNITVKLCALAGGASKRTYGIYAQGYNHNYVQNRFFNLKSDTNAYIIGGSDSEGIVIDGINVDTAIAVLTTAVTVNATVPAGAVIIIPKQTDGYTNLLSTTNPQTVILPGQMQMQLGTASLPTYSFANDPNTGIYSPGADQVGVATGGIGRTLWTGAIFRPISNDGCALGSASVAWADLFLASGGVINWANSDATITHTTGLLTFSKPIKITPVAVASLPSAATVGAGTRHFVTDANATTYASVVAGGGSNNVPVYSDGTNWRIG